MSTDLPTSNWRLMKDESPDATAAELSEVVPTGIMKPCIPDVNIFTVNEGMQQALVQLREIQLNATQRHEELLQKFGSHRSGGGRISEARRLDTKRASAVGSGPMPPETKRASLRHDTANGERPNRASIAPHLFEHSSLAGSVRRKEAQQELAEQTNGWRTSCRIDDGDSAGTPIDASGASIVRHSIGLEWDDDIAHSGKDAFHESGLEDDEGDELCHTVGTDGTGSGSATTRKFDADMVDKILGKHEPERGGRIAGNRETLEYVPVSPQGVMEHLSLIAKHPRFDTLCGSVIIFNAVLIGLEADAIAANGKNHKWIDDAQFVLNIWYMAELMLRLTQGRDFFTGKDMKWNMFDLILISCTAADLFISSFGELDMGRLFRGIRLFRIIRTLRIARQLNYVREFRKMVFSLMLSMRTLFWSLVLLIAVLYNFALWFAQSAAAIIAAEDHPRDSSDLKLYFGSLGQTFLTLFLSISNGVTWGMCVDTLLLHDMAPSAGLYIGFIALCLFGVLNVVSAVFVESALQSTQHYKDLLVQEKIHNTQMIARHLKAIFHQIDTDGGGSISFHELEAFMLDHDAEVHSYFEALELDIDDTWMLFRLLDEDESGEVNIDDFCAGCMRLKGDARSFDLNCMLFENRAMVRNWGIFMHYVEDEFEVIKTELNWLREGTSGLREGTRGLREGTSGTAAPACNAIDTHRSTDGIRSTDGEVLNTHCV